MAETEKQQDVIDLSGCIQYGPEDLKNELRKVRALIVFMLGSGPDVETKDVGEALYTLQYLIEDVNYK